MRLVVHDYSGHPFQAQLSRQLAARGHRVMHWYCASYASGKGQLQWRSGDSDSLSFSPLYMSTQFDRYSVLKRIRQEVSYGYQLGRRLQRARPEVAILCNTPLLAHIVAVFLCARARVPMLFWQQDLYSVAIGTAARQRLGSLGKPLGFLADQGERYVARSSQRIVSISEDFLPTIKRWGVCERCAVIPNWAPLPEMPERPKQNHWAETHDLAHRQVVMYSGTLGVKHDPAILLSVAQAVGTALPDARVVVISEGRGREWLTARLAAAPLTNVLLLDYQPYALLPDVLGTADVLLAILDAAASRYSVPSKLLTYLCTGRAIVGALPRDNPAADVLRASGGGVVVPPDASERVANEILELLRNSDRRAQMGSAGRRYAESAFNIDSVAARFERLLELASEGGAPKPISVYQRATAEISRRRTKM